MFLDHYCTPVLSANALYLRAAKRELALAAQDRFRKDREVLCPEVDAGDLRLGPRIGSGTFSDVYMGHWCVQPVAVKVFRTTAGREEETWQMYMNELRLLSALSGPRVVNLLGAFVGGDACLHLLVELASADLHTVLHGGNSRPSDSSETLLPAHRFLLATETAEAVAYLHAQAPPIVHRDIKSKNVVVFNVEGEGPLSVKLIDFGLSGPADASPGGAARGVADEAGRWGAPQSGPWSGCPEVRGSAGYMAPECLALQQRPGGHPGALADVWALGCVLAEVFGGAPPHPDCADLRQVSAKVLTKGLAPDVPHHVDLAAGGPPGEGRMRSLVLSCFTREADRRPCAAEVLSRLRELQACWRCV